MTDSTAQAIKTPVPTPNRPISKLLGWAIALAPYLFAWVTLRKGTSKRARILSFGWMTLFVSVHAIQEYQGKGLLSQTRRNLTAVAASTDAIKQAKDRHAPPPAVEAALAPPAEDPTRPVTREELRKQLADLRKASAYIAVRGHSYRRRADSKIAAVDTWIADARTSSCAEP